MRGKKPLFNLTIKRRWFVAIATGEKREEYRKWQNAQCATAYSRLFHTGVPKDAVAVFRAGYRMDSPALAVVVTGLELRCAKQAKHREWGEEPGVARWVISLGEVLKQGDYLTVKTWMATQGGGLG